MNIQIISIKSQGLLQHRQRWRRGEAEKGRSWEAEKGRRGEAENGGTGEAGNRGLFYQPFVRLI